MKNMIKLLSIMLSLLIIFSCGKDDNPAEPQTPPEQTVDISGYYPNSVGSNYTYKSNAQAGEKTVSVDRAGSDSRYTVQRVVDGFNGGTISEVVYRTESDSICFLIDEAELLAMVPDSMIQQYQLSLEVGSEMVLVAQESVKGLQWNVLSLQVIFGGAFKFPVLKLTGENVGTESIAIPNKNENVNAMKIKYTMDLTIPDPADPLNGAATTGHYESFIWLAESIGMVKLSGNALFLNSFSTGNFSFDDTLYTIDQYLFDYQIAQ